MIETFKVETMKTKFYNCILIWITGKFIVNNHTKNLHKIWGEFINHNKYAKLRTKHADLIAQGYKFPDDIEDLTDFEFIDQNNIALSTMIKRRDT